jgi:hypothetical protein
LRHRLQPHDPAEPLRDALLFTMLRAEFDASPMASFELRAFDATGGAVELD